MKIAYLPALLTLLPLSSCSTFWRAPKVDVVHERITTETGVEYEDIIVGEGPAAQVGQTVALDYSGYLSSGTLFDSSIERGNPIRITLGESPIAGWDEGVPGMQAGGSRWMKLPAEQAYGKAGVPGLIPENEPLVFEIHLLEIEAEAEAETEAIEAGAEPATE